MKLLKFVTAAGIAAGLSSAFTLPATAEDPTHNFIQLERYYVDPAPYSEWGGPAIVAVSFVNHGTIPATDVLFDVRGEDGISKIDDVGTFSPGVQIHHEFRSFTFPTNPTVRVAAVRYADGSMWNASDNVTPLPRRQATKL